MGEIILAVLGMGVAFALGYTLALAAIEAFISISYDMEGK